MAIKLKSIKAQTKTLDPIMFGEDSLNVEFFMNVYTPRFEEESARRQRSGQEQTAGEALGTMVVPLIASWDLVDDFEVGKMVERTTDMVLVSSATRQIALLREDDEPEPETDLTENIYILPVIEDWRFYYQDEKTGLLVESAREEVISSDEKTGTCVINSFVPKIDKSGNPFMVEHVVPVTVTGMSNIPMIVMTQILTRVGESMTPGEAKKPNSEESSFTD